VPSASRLSSWSWKAAVTRTGNGMQALSTRSMWLDPASKGAPTGPPRCRRRTCAQSPAASSRQRAPLRRGRGPRRWWAAAVVVAVRGRGLRAGHPLGGASRPPAPRIRRPSACAAAPGRRPRRRQGSGGRDGRRSRRSRQAASWPRSTRRRAGRRGVARTGTAPHRPSR
jgi:hypothetical protein